jgi:tripartite-type tricarboxylate transporter receptor subunit TctC
VKKVRFALLAALAAGGLALPAIPVQAQPYPSRPVRLIVPQAAGAQNDVLARLLGERLTAFWKEAAVVENHGGVGGTIGADLVAKAPADGYTVLVGGLNNLVVAPALTSDLRYDPIRDFAPVGGLARVPYALAVNRRVPANTLAELVAYARANPGRLSYGSAGNGSMSNLGAELLKSMAGLDIVHVPYRGSAPAIKALVSGEVDMIFSDLSQLAQQAKAGSVRLLAAAGTARVATAPELPTVAEQGFPEFGIEPWYGVVVPAGTAPEIVSKLADGLHETLNAPEIQQRLQQLGYEAMRDTPEQFGALIRDETRKYATLIKRAGIHGEP